VSASVNLPLHHKVQKFSSGTGSPGWSRKKGRKTVVCVCVCDSVKHIPTECIAYKSVAAAALCTHWPHRYIQSFSHQKCLRFH